MKNFLKLEVKKDGASSINMFAFYLVLVGECVSYIGSGIMCFGQAVWIYTDLGGTITNLALITVVAHLPGMLLSPLAGVVADRYDRRIIMIICNSIAVLSTLLLRALVVTHTFQLWHIYIITALIGMATRFQWPAYIATIPQIVPPRHLGRANGLVSTTQGIGYMFAPIFAGFLITTVKIEGVILIDLVTFLFAFSTLMIVRFPKVNRDKTEIKGTKVLEDLKSGFSSLIKKSGMLNLISLTAVPEMVAGIVGTLFLPMLLGVTSTTMGGTILSVGGIGGLVGGIIVSIWGGPKKRIKGILFFMIMAGIALIIGSIYPFIPLFFISLFFFNFCFPLFTTSTNVIIQKKNEDKYRGRILAIQAMIYSITLHVGLMFGAPIADRFFEPAMSKTGILSNTVGRILGTGKGRGIALLFLILGIILIITAIMGYFNKKIRYVEINNISYLNNGDDDSPLIMPEPLPAGNKPLTDEV